MIDKAGIISKILSIMMIAAVMMPQPGFAIPESGSVEHAADLEEYIDATDPAAAPALSDDESSDEELAVFGTRRLKVKLVLDSLEGASEGVSYDGNTLLSFDTAAETKEAYERLSEKYGAGNVVVDLPLMSAESAAEPVGWGTDYMNLDDKMKREVRTKGEKLGTVTVAVIDSGVTSTHEIFSGKTITADSKSFLNESDTVADENGHGTEVAGIIAESTPDNVELMILKVFVNGTSISTETVNQAIRYAAENGADVINLSMATEFADYYGSYPEIIDITIGDMEAQLKAAADNGVIICAASGNSGGDIDALNAYPAKSSHTLAVGSIDKEGNRSSFSNHGDALDFCAPGQELITASKDNDTGYVFPLDSGTSLASPYIAACCAYIKMDDPDADNESAKETLKSISVDYGDAGWDSAYGWGMPKYEDFDEAAYDREQKEQKAKSVKTVTVNTATVTGNTIDKAVIKAGGKRKYVTKVVFGSKVKKIGSGALRNYSKVTTLELKTKKLTKKSVRNSLKSSKVKTVKIKVSSKVSINRNYVKKYKTYFTKANSGRKVTVKR